MFHFAAIHRLLQGLMCAGALSPCACLGAGPQLDYLFPAGARQGAEDVVITAGGKFEKWPVTVWTNAAEGWLRFVANPDEKKKGELTVSVAADCAPGAYLVRLHSDEGVSVARVFVVGSIPEVREVEPNDTYEKPQVMELEPGVRLMNGQLEKRGDVDCFAFDLDAGQVLVAEVAAYVLDSPVDPLLQVRGPEGYRIAFNHDAPGHLLDPRLVFKAPTTGRYTLELAGFAHPPRADVRFTGSAATRYRLTLSTTIPLVTHTRPLAVERGTIRDLKVFLTNGTCTSLSVTVPEEFAIDEMFVDHEESLRPIAITVSDVNEQVEPVDSLAIPGAITGTIGIAEEVDQYPFVASKDTTLVFTVDAAGVGSALDPVLSIANADGKELASNDDVAHRFDPELTWKAPVDGDYEVSVRSRFRKHGGAEFYYRLVGTVAQPETIITAAVDNLTVKHGEKAELTLNIVRKHGHGTPLTIEPQGLPAGVSIAPTEIPADSKGEWKLTFESSVTDTSVPTCSPFRLSVRETGMDEPVTLIYHPLKGTTTDAGELLINTTADLWLTHSVK